MPDHIVDATKMAPQWDVDGNPLNLLAAAEDAYEWVHYFSCHAKKKDKRLSDSATELRKFLDEAVRHA